MSVARRRRLLSIGTIGTLLTLFVLGADTAGWLQLPERALHDLRARDCQYFLDPPTDRIAHVDIDDGALDQVGRWPWSRTLIADIVDEMNAAGAKLIVLDVLFSEPTHRRDDDQESGDAATPTTASTSADAKAAPVDPDERLADAFRRGKNVVVAASLAFQRPDDVDSVDVAATKELTDDLELEPAQLIERLASRGTRDPEVQRRVTSSFTSLRGEALRRRINREFDGGPATTDELMSRLLPRAAAQVDMVSPLKRQFREEFEHVLTIRAMRRFAATPGSDTPQLIPTRGGNLPIARIATAAAYGGFVDYVPESDGVVRRIPLACWHEQSVLPTVGLVAACVTMGVDVRDVRFAHDSVIVPRPGGDLVIPTLTQPDGPYAGTGAYLEVPLFGQRARERGSWERMYDYPTHREPKARVPVLDIVSACQTKARIARNENVARILLARILDVIDPTAADDLKSQAPTGDDLARRVDDAIETLKATTDSLAKVQDRNEKEEAEFQRFRSAGDFAKKLSGLRVQQGKFIQQLDQQRSRLAERLKDRVVFVGSIATGASDFVPSSLDAQCPGVYLHGATFNAIMTGQFIRTAPRWVTVIAILAIGLLSTVAAALLSPSRALGAVLLMGGGYAVLNGIVLFDKYNVIVGAAGPLVCAALVWSGVTLIQFIREIGERTRLTRRFSSYVDPTLVNYVVENPEQVRLEAHEMELTVCFTDLQGFTTLAEKLRAQSAKLLGQYMEAMVPLIRARHGYVNKFLGDGIMFFFGAPIENPEHAAGAVGAVLDMQRALVTFNEGLSKQNLPTLAVRAGVSTGLMVVGDAGPSFASDYTVLGDAVNLAARLESANKAFGTSNLITSRTVELLGDRYLVRPVANLLVVGKHESVIVHEALAPIEMATPEQKQIAAATANVFTSFAESRWDDCDRALAELVKLAGESKLIKLYHEEIAARRDKPREETFRGQIQLFAK